jgi:hypothetical protein
MGFRGGGQISISLFSYFLKACEMRYFMCIFMLIKIYYMFSYKFYKKNYGIMWNFCFYIERYNV